MDEAIDTLHTLAEGIDFEDLEMQGEQNDNDIDDNVEGWVDERNALSTADCNALDASICPVKLVLIKVISCIFVRRLLLI